MESAAEIEYRLLIQAVVELKSDSPQLRIAGAARLREAADRIVHSKMVDSARIVSGVRSSDTAADVKTKRARRYAKVLRDAGFEFPGARKQWRPAALKILQERRQEVDDTWLRNHAALLREQFDDL